MEESPKRTHLKSSELPAEEGAPVPPEEPAETEETVRPEAEQSISVDELLGTAGPGEADAGIPALDLPRAASILESLLLVSTDPLSIDKARQLLGEISREQFEEVYLALQAKYPRESSGIIVEKVAKGVQFRTSPANQEHVRKLFDVKPPRFSRAALETVAIIAYKQPLTRQEIEQIRGVDCAGSLRTLMERRLVRVVGKKDVPGKPFLFGTTREFMEVFGLGSLGDLPSMREIEEYLSASTATPVDAGRPGIDLPPAGAGTETEWDTGDSSVEGSEAEGIGTDEAPPNEGEGKPDGD